jgi:hypothetical protein
LDEPNAGAFAAIFDPEGKLRAQIALSWSDLFKNGKNFAYKSAALAVADQMGSLGADKACLAIDSSLVADIFQLTDFHAALASRFCSAREAFGHPPIPAEHFSVAFDARADFSFAAREAGRLARKSTDEADSAIRQAALDHALELFSASQVFTPAAASTPQKIPGPNGSHARHETPKPILFDSRKSLPPNSPFDLAMSRLHEQSSTPSAPSRKP